MLSSCASWTPTIWSAPDAEPSLRPAPRLRPPHRRPRRRPGICARAAPVRAGAGADRTLRRLARGRPRRGRGARRPPGPPPRMAGRCRRAPASRRPRHAGGRRSGPQRGRPRRGRAGRAPRTTRPARLERRPSRRDLPHRGAAAFRLRQHGGLLDAGRGQDEARRAGGERYAGPRRRQARHARHHAPGPPRLGPEDREGGVRPRHAPGRLLQRPHARTRARGDAGALLLRGRPAREVRERSRGDLPA